MNNRGILLIMVDGLGLPPTGYGQSIYRDCSTLLNLFEHHMVPLDARLSVPGLPQSATGQATMLTGVNAADLVGRHLSGFPNERLRELVAGQSVFAQLQAHGYSCTFANAYAMLAEQRALMPSPASVSTVAARSALPRLRNRRDLLAGQAVYHDLTRGWLREKGDPSIPLIEEEEAAEHLLGVVRTVDFCLFEYFLTDHAGHRGSLGEKKRVLASLDRFLAALLRGFRPERELMLLVSDHGNIENLQSRFHSVHPVPWIAVGAAAGTALAGMNSLLQVTPKIIELCRNPAFNSEA